MGYRMYASCRKVKDECFGKLFGYRDDITEGKSEALDYLLRNSTLLEDNFYYPPPEVSEIVSMFGSSYQFRCTIRCDCFLLFMYLYAKEAAQRWIDEGETIERSFNYMKNIMDHTLEFIENCAFYDDIHLEWI